MPFNFKKCQEEFPDALQLTVSTTPGSPISEEELSESLGGGKIMHSWRSKDGYRMKVVVSKLAAARIIVIYGPQGSGKSTLAQKYAKLFKSHVTVRYDDLIDVPKNIDCLVIDEWPVCVDLLDARYLYNLNGNHVSVKHVIITLQTGPSVTLKPREGVFFIKKTI